MFTLAMPQSLPTAERKRSAESTLRVKIEEERPWGTPLWRAMASSRVSTS
jgi:hypothetical protein